MTIVKKQLELKQILIYFGFFIGISACANDLPKPDYGLNQKLNFSAEEYKNVFKDYLIENSQILKSLNMQYYDTLINFYSARNFEPVFIKSFEEKTFIDSVLNLFERANEHGLSPNSYHITEFKNAFNEATLGSFTNAERYAHLSKAEILAADGILKYSSHLRYGLLNPKDILIDSYFMPITDSSKRNLIEPLEQTDILKYLYDIQPKSKKYKELQSVLKTFEALRGIDWKPIKVPAKKIVVGHSDSSVIHIAERLNKLGFLSSENLSLISHIKYDTLLADAVKKFQSANGLISDGVIAKGTIEKLNTSPGEYVKKIKVNLERFRWFDYSDTSRYILVNIPDFKLHMIDQGKEMFNITVCTGRKRSEYVFSQLKKYKETNRKPPKLEDWETPVLYSQLRHLILNPTWTVPFSIMREEIASKVRRDSTYLKRANFRVYKNGSQISPTEVKVNELTSGSIPYTIIQNPGAGNALGKIKFMFDNPFGVYLHDTPTRAPFKYENRAVSHGCVRVEQPLQLAEYILKDNSNWTLDYLKLEIGKKVEDKNIVEQFKQKRGELRKGSSYGQTTEAKLFNSIPIFIDYYTAWVDESGIVNFRNDVYRQDKIVTENLFK